MNETHLRTSWILLLTLAACKGAGGSDTGGGTDTEGCQDGQIGCACSPGDTCVAPGVCQEGVCMPPAPGVCGDGNLDLDEECDLGQANSDAGSCKTDCTIQRCGDGAVGPGEACDDGNQVDDDMCTNMCALPTCGDGVVQAPEACDDGNDVDTDACLSTCIEATCGDGIVQEGVEECDDANMDDFDGCRADCRLVVDASCSDGMVQPGEFCFEDSNTLATGTVNPSRVVAGDFTGDGHLDAAVLFRDADRVQLFTGDGTGALTPGAQVSIRGNMDPPQGAGDMVAVDVDGDDKLDLAIAAGATDRVIHMINTGGSPPFALGSGETLVGNTTPAAMTVGDFDGDGVEDYAVGTTSGLLHVFVQGASPSADTGGNTIALLAAADMDGSGTDEVVALSPIDDVVLVYEMVGGSLSKAATVDLTGGKLPWKAAGGDVDGDGVGDVVFTHWTYNGCDLSMQGAPCVPGRLITLHGEGSGLADVGTFTEVVTGPAPLPLVLADFTGDGTLDAAAVSGATGYVWVQREAGTAPLELTETLDLSVGNSFLHDLDEGDFNEDGVPDMVSVHGEFNSLRVILSTP